MINRNAAAVREMTPEEFLENEEIELGEWEYLLDEQIVTEGAEEDHGHDRSEWVLCASPDEGDAEIKWNQREVPQLDEYLLEREHYKRVSAYSRQRKESVSFDVVLQVKLVSLSVTRHEVHRWGRMEVYWECEAKFEWRA